MALSKAQADRLGERLRGGDIRDADVGMLNAYRQSFAEPYAAVLSVLRDRLGLSPTGRPAKSTQAIVDKLRRESVRLSQIQDVAGCRVVVPDILAQDRTTQAVREAFDGAAIVDRRARPSHGYRAVHILVPMEGRRVEVQVRTELQQRWAELSETLSDAEGIAVKYGGGRLKVREVLDDASTAIATLEGYEVELRELERRATPTGYSEDVANGLRILRANQAALRTEIRTAFERAVVNLSHSQ